MARGANTRRHLARHTVAQMRRLAIAELYRQEVDAGRVSGVGRHIADRLGLGYATVSEHLKAIRAALPPAIESEATKIRVAIIKRIDAARSRLDAVESEITAEWHRSKLDEQSTEVQQSVIEGKPTGIAHVKKRTKGQTGNPAYTAQMVAIETARLALDKELRELMGIDAPTKTEEQTYDLTKYDFNEGELDRLIGGELPLIVIKAWEVRKRATAAA